MPERTLTVPDDDQIARMAPLAWKARPDTFAHHLSHKSLPPITGGGSPWEHYRHSTFLAQRFRRLVTTPGSREIWNLPPRHGKSLIASVWGPAWALDLWPTMRIIDVSYADQLATSFGRDVRNVLDAYGDDLRVQLRPDSKAAGRWNTPQGGGMLCAGVHGTITGFGANLLVIDDPFENWQDAESITTREKVWNTWLSTLRTRLEPGASVLIVMTRWHEDDLVGRLHAQDEAGDGEGWVTIRLPAVAEAPSDKYPLPDPLGRAPGEALCPERFDADVLAATQRQSGSYIWSGMYQQRPSPAEGGIFRRSWWKFYERPPHRDRIEELVGSWDASLKDKQDSSYCVGQVWARIGAHRYLLWQVRDHMNYPELRAAVRNLAAMFPECHRWLVEDAANGPAVVADLKAVVRGLIPNPVKGSKVARARMVTADVEAGNVWLPEPSPEYPWVAEYIEEHAAFPNGTHDDQVDSTSQALAAIGLTVETTVGTRTVTKPVRGRR